MKQRTFFDAEFERDMRSKRSAEPIDPNVTDLDVPRLRGQNAAILERLKEGPATNVELSAISLKYTSRISDIRAAGHGVSCTRGPGGVNVYRLI